MLWFQLSNRLQLQPIISTNTNTTKLLFLLEIRLKIQITLKKITEL